MMTWLSCAGVPRGCVYGILRRDDHSGVLIGSIGTRRFDWPEHVYASARESIDRARGAIDITQAFLTELLHK